MPLPAVAEMIVVASEVLEKVCAEPLLTPVEDPATVVNVLGVNVKFVPGIVSRRIVHESPLTYVAEANVAVTPRVPIAAAAPVVWLTADSRPLTLNFAVPTAPPVVIVIV